MTKCICIPPFFEEDCRAVGRCLASPEHEVTMSDTLLLLDLVGVALKKQYPEIKPEDISNLKVNSWKWVEGILHVDVSVTINAPTDIKININIGET